MRHLASLTLLAASVSAQTYTNTFSNTDPALTYGTGPGDKAWDPSVPYTGSYSAIQKPWDVTATNGSVVISGWGSLPQSYINTYPALAAAGGAVFTGETTLSGLSSFKVSDVGSLSYRITVGQLDTANPFMLIRLVTSGGVAYSIHQGNSTVTLTRSNGTSGDYIYTYTNLAIDPNDRTYAGIQFMTAMSWAPTAGGGYAPVAGSFHDLTLQEVSVTLGAGTPAVPEPSTYGLMLGGLALAGAVIRRRRSK